ncbi:unknown protein [Paenibacillus amylolyticus]|uniref:Uncharacterized protein n=1 Tax=Paenibacillus amylolyticus TaxID=1451 RepID=A0A100VMP8_PAEAM|nr:unknown protein [Paenibacillus amylolyticus]
MKLDIDKLNRFDLYLPLIEAAKGIMKLIYLNQICLQTTQRTGSVGYPSAGSF